MSRHKSGARTCDVCGRIAPTVKVGRRDRCAQHVTFDSKAITGTASSVPEKFEPSEAQRVAFLTSIGENYGGAQIADFVKVLEGIA